VILLRHSMAQKNLHTSEDSTVRGGELPTELLCGGNARSWPFRVRCYATVDLEKVERR
jgi:hypothetical protein